MNRFIEQVFAGKRRYAVVQGDCGKLLLDLPEACFDAAIIDPPGALGFCGKEWDGDLGGRDAWVQTHARLFRAHSRVVKPGRFVFVWSFPRTEHWTGLAIEEAGLEIVDGLYHLFSHRKPSSPNLLKVACEKWWLCRVPGDTSVPAAGSRWKTKSFDVPTAVVEVLGSNVTTDPELGLRVAYVSFAIMQGPDKGKCLTILDETFFGHFTPAGGSRTPKSGSTPTGGSKTPRNGSKVELGIGACLIPAVQRPGTGAKPSEGRHPTNAVLTHLEAQQGPCGPGCVVAELDRLSGQLRSGVGAKVGKSKKGYRGNTYGAHCREQGTACVCYGDEGGASRFFTTLQNDLPFVYANRASRKERNAGLPEGMINEGVAVKPEALMVHLVKLANVPAGGIVLDGFAGTGSTGCACAKLGVRFIGIEQNDNDAAVAARRIGHHLKPSEVSR